MAFFLGFSFSVFIKQINSPKKNSQIYSIFSLPSLSFVMKEFIPAVRQFTKSFSFSQYYKMGNGVRVVYKTHISFNSIVKCLENEVSFYDVWYCVCLDFWKRNRNWKNNLRKLGFVSTKKVNRRSNTTNPRKPPINLNIFLGSYSYLVHFTVSRMNFFTNKFPLF